MRILGCIVVFGLFALSMFVLPLAWPLRLWRTSFALTTHRLVIRQPGLVILWSQVRNLYAEQVQEMRVWCIWTWLPHRAGDIAYGVGFSRRMERVPEAERIVELIKQTLTLMGNGNDSSPVSPMAPSGG